jgi:hypothetical protein
LSDPAPLSSTIGKRTVDGGTTWYSITGNWSSAADDQYGGDGDSNIILLPRIGSNA